jgi:hypothetical protein
MVDANKDAGCGLRPCKMSTPTGFANVDVHELHSACPKGLNGLCRMQSVGVEVDWASVIALPILLRSGKVRLGSVNSSLKTFLTAQRAGEGEKRWVEIGGV